MSNGSSGARRSIGVVCGLVLVGWSLACGSASDGERSPEPASEAPPSEPKQKPVVSPSPPPGLLPWQEAYAERPTKDVVDYYMLLPELELFSCDDIDGPTTEAERDRAITERSVQNGYLATLVSATPAQVAVYRDRTNDRNVVAVSMNGGLGNMCNGHWFGVWNQAKRDWEVLHDLTPSQAEIEARLPPDTAWFLSLPKEGTDTPVVDADGKVLMVLKWDAGRFVLPRP